MPWPGALMAISPIQASAMARAGKEHVRAEFLTPRYLRDHLRSYQHVLKA